MVCSWSELAVCVMPRSSQWVGALLSPDHLTPPILSTDLGSRESSPHGAQYETVIGPGEATESCSSLSPGWPVSVCRIPWKRWLLPL
jgi:hypothetical protein